MSFLNIPNEVVLAIVSLLDERDDVDAIAGCCRRLKDIVDQNPYRLAVIECRGIYVEPSRIDGRLMIVHQPNPILPNSTRPRPLVTKKNHCYAAKSIFCMNVRFDEDTLELLGQLIADINAHFENNVHLQRAPSDREIMFHSCHFPVSTTGDQLKRVIAASCPRPLNLSFLHCTMDYADIFNDVFFSGFDSLYTFEMFSDNLILLPNLTDATLQFFATLHNLSKVSFKNLRPAFTVEGYERLQERSGLKKWDAELEEIVLLRTFEKP